jgi:triosephosphate isomerase (TIM)
MRKNIVAGNWKMNTNLAEGLELVNQIKNLQSAESSVELIIIPPFTHIDAISKSLSNTAIAMGAQNCSQQQAGAFTGEISANMLSSFGVKYVLVGHSERRAFFNENEDVLALKVDSILSNAMTPIYCCGETLEQRQSSLHLETIKEQIEAGLFHLSAVEISQLIIAYEPVWAIGTGLTATAIQAQEIHQFIRSLIAEKYGDVVANALPILYGGSVKPANAKELFACEDIDGGLIGGAALNANDLISIANSI